MKNKSTITVSHNNYNSYLLYHADFVIISLAGNVIFHQMKWKIWVDIISGGGESVGYTIAKEIWNFADDQHIKNDIFSSSNGGKEVIPPYVKVYPNKISQYEKIIIKKKVVSKNVFCISSDNFLRSTTIYLMTILSSIFIEGKIPQDHLENTKLGTDGSQKFVGMMQDTFGKDV